MDPKDAIEAIKAGRHVYEDSRSPYHVSLTWHKEPLWRAGRYISDIRSGLADRFWCQELEHISIIEAGPRCVYVKYDIILPPNLRNNTFFFEPNRIERLRRMKERYDINDMFLEGNGRKVEVWDLEVPSDIVELY